MYVGQMKTKKKGFYRDRNIIEDIRLFEILNTEQIYVRHFRNIKNLQQALTKTRRRLQFLSDTSKKGILKRERISFYEPYYYYLKRRNNVTVTHEINRNWGILYLLEKYKDKYKLFDLQIEYVVKDLRADGFLTLCRYINPNERLYFFIESDKEESNNRFTKISKYNEFFSKQSYKGLSWVKNTKRFPPILIVSNSKNKIKKIKEMVVDKKYNYNNLEFITILVDDIKKMFGLL